MSTNAAIGHGSLFEIGNDDSPETFTTLGEVITMTLPSLARAAVDATHQGSTDRWRDFIGGLRDGGEFKVDWNFDPGGTVQTQLFEAFNENGHRTYRITFPDTTAWTFEAFVTGISGEVPLDDKMTISGTFKLTGKPSFVV